MSTKTMSVYNPRTGNTVEFGVDGPTDPRASILQQRLNRGALSVGGSKDNTRTAVVDIDAGVKDEKGDYLKSVHGGGLDPDAAGDALGVPSGSGKSLKEAADDAQVAAAEVAKQADAAAESGAKLSATAEAAAEAAGPSKVAKKVAKK